MTAFRDLTAQVFGHWVVLRCASRNPTYWKCRCACGCIKAVFGYSLTSGKSKSCGCLRPNQTTHGMYKTREYNSWNAMIQRCTNPNNPEYPEYGGRGISICKRWFKFENFYLDMGERPANKTLDRKNSNGNYSKRNCRWATITEQNNNRRNTKTVLFQGRRISVAKAARLSGLTKFALYAKLKRGDPIDFQLRLKRS